MDRFLKTADLRKLEKQVINEEITYSKMVENINYQAFVYYITKLDKQIDMKSTMINVIKHLMDSDLRNIYVKDGWTEEQMAVDFINSLVVFKPKD